MAMIIQQTDPNNKNIERSVEKMAIIRCMDPNKIAIQMKNMFDVTDTLGKNLIKEMKSILQNLRTHWRGTDAATQLKKLSDIYNKIDKNIVEFQDLIIDFNNEKIIKLQKHLVDSGETCTVGQKLNSTLKIEDISKKAYEDRVLVREAFFDNMSKVKETLKAYKTFINELKDEKNVMLNNLTSGCGRDSFIAQYNTLNNNASANINELTTISSKLNIIIYNKNKFYNKNDTYLNAANGMFNNLATKAKTTTNVTTNTQQQVAIDNNINIMPPPKVTSEVKRFGDTIGGTQTNNK